MGCVGARFGVCSTLDRTKANSTSVSPREESGHGHVRERGSSLASETLPVQMFGGPLRLAWRDRSLQLQRAAILGAVIDPDKVPRETFSQASRRELPANANRLLLHKASRPLRFATVPSVVEEARKLRAASTHSRFSLYSVHTPSVRGIDRQSPAKAGVATVNSAANRMGFLKVAIMTTPLVGAFRP